VSHSASREAIAAAGAEMPHIQHERDLLIGVIRRYLPNQLIDLLARNVPMAAGAIQRARQLGRGTAAPPERKIGDQSLAVDEHDHFRDEATQQVLPVGVGGCWSLPYSLQIGPSPTQPRRILLTQRSGSTAPESVQLFLALSDVLQSFLPGPLERRPLTTIAA
jgi:hypothetical protein